MNKLSESAIKLDDADNCSGKYFFVPLRARWNQPCQEQVVENGETRRGSRTCYSGRPVGKEDFVEKISSILGSDLARKNPDQRGMMIIKFMSPELTMEKRSVLFSSLLIVIAMLGGCAGKTGAPVEEWKQRLTPRSLSDLKQTPIHLRGSTFLKNA